ncbi:MAG: hypothetical protein Q9164_004127 [Protoblastenia rupestris]
MDVASAMGFASFGTKPHLAKKRKTGKSDMEVSGSNSLPLGSRPDRSANEPQSMPTMSQGSVVPHSLQDNEHLHIQETQESSQSKSFDVHAQQQPENASGAFNCPAGHDREEGRMGNGQWDWQALRRGVRDERGDTAFYDASFTEDPWAGLRQK